MDAQDIQAAYERLEFDLSWFFLLCREARLYDAKVATVGLNPGGSHYDPPAWDFAGNAYFENNWSEDPTKFDRVQRQMHALYALMGWGREDVLAAQFVPFRSPSWATLKNRELALEFARDLWRWVLSISPAQTFLCMGKVVTDEMVRLTNAKPADPCSFPTGWGGQTFERYVTDDARVIVKWPHPSRYLLFGRTGQKSSVAESSIQRAVS